MIYVWQYYEYNLDSDYARVLIILGLHMVLNKILCIDIWQGSEQASSSVENTPSYMFDGVLYSLGSHYAKAWIYKGCEYVKIT